MRELGVFVENNDSKTSMHTSGGAYGISKEKLRNEPNDTKDTDY